MAKTMSEKEYFEAVARIRSYTANGQLEEAERLLDRMYMYKPVRLLWFVAKAEYIQKKTGNPMAALTFLNDKYTFEPGYPGLEECMQFVLPILRQFCEMRDAVRVEYLYRKACGEECHEQEEHLAEVLEKFAQDPENRDVLMALGDAFFHTSDMLSYLIVRLEQLRTGALTEDIREYWFYKNLNYGFLEEKVKSEETNTFILVMDEYLDRSLEILGSLLSGFGHKVFLLIPPLPFETATQVELKETVAISLEQTEKFPDMCVIPPVMLTQNGESYGDNRAYLIDHICRKESGRDNAIILGSGYLLENLTVRAELRGRIGRLSAYYYESEEEKLQFGWAGDYLSYISDIYGYDVRNDLDVPAEVDFSIVIPVRNSAETLRYTLKTCLNQRYRGSYEILVSDNSVDQDTGVYELCQELNDPRIRYIRTPRMLQLTKSFEFAYLHTRGEFILSMGSDDALLPWGLEAVKYVLNQFPDENIVQWDRGFYAWPGFNGGQENMLEILRTYEKGALSCCLKKTEAVLEDVARDIGGVYSMPSLYINSGFRRRHMKTLLQKTGKLWDGGNQDLHTGVINCCIYDHYVQMLYPITIAGMSDSSMGYLNKRGAFGKERERAEALRQRQNLQDNVGIYTMLARERRLPPVGVDACSLYLVLSRVVAEGLLSEAAADQIWDWRRAVQKAFETYPAINDNFDPFVHQVMVEARRMGKQQADWFEKQIYRIALIPHYVDESQMKREKSYQEGTNSLGVVTLDASKFGVRNVAEAAELFAKRTGL